jgi:hypothetical protein
MVKVRPSYIFLGLTFKKMEWRICYLLAGEGNNEKGT